MNKDLKVYIQRVDPDIYEALHETENFEAIVDAIKGDADEIMEQIIDPDPVGGTGSNYEQIAYLFAMQNRALNQLIEEIEELRPSIRFLTSILLGNAEKEADGDD